MPYRIEVKQVSCVKWWNPLTWFKSKEIYSRRVWDMDSLMKPSELSLFLEDSPHYVTGETKWVKGEIK